MEFQSTHPVWGATKAKAETAQKPGISIHAPRVGCDADILAGRTATPEFQSTHPVWGATFKRRDGEQSQEVFQSTHPVWGATRRAEDKRSDALFQSTHPVWGATGIVLVLLDSVRISIHAPRVGCDECASDKTHPYAIFQSTHPVWGATIVGKDLELAPYISIHAPRVGCDAAGNLDGPAAIDFNPRTPCGVRLST